MSDATVSGYPRNRDHRGRQRSAIQRCRDCQRLMFWVTMPSGKRNPLDLEPQEDDPTADVLVIEKRRGGDDGERWLLGVVLQHPTLIEEAANLAFELHTSHFATCPSDEATARRRRGRGD